MEKYDILKIENQMCFPLYAASRQIIRQYHTVLDELDLTYTQYIVMLVLWENQTLCVKDLGARLYLDSGTLTPVLKSLEKKGYIKRTRSCEDERVLHAQITETGVKLRKKASEVPQKVGGCVNLDPEEAQELRRLLYKLLDSFSSEGR